MKYIIKHKDTPVLRFMLAENTANPIVHIEWMTDNISLLPMGMSLDDDGLSRWLHGRIAPKNRAFVNNFLSKCGLSINRPMDIIPFSKGLSLNDVYWVVEEDFQGSFEKYNLYENNFSNILAMIAFTGYGSSLHSSHIFSPEFTTSGMLPKCWRRICGKVYLYKGGTSGESNTGFEPYSEFYASEIAKTMGVNAIEYRLNQWNGVLCSSCEIFTNLNYSYIPICKIVKTGEMQVVRKFYESLGPKFVDALNEMLVFDAVICNTDRHFGNFGVLVDNETNRIVKPAPLFDHGNSLFNFAGKDDLESVEAFEAYISTLLPQAYDDFIADAKAVITDRNREQLRHLLTYRLRKNPRYNIPESRYGLIARQIQKRASLLLK